MRPHAAGSGCNSSTADPRPGPLGPGQLGRIFENLIENAYTSGSEGRLISYLPVLDSRGVDRAVSVGGGPPLYLQVKGHLHPRDGGRLSFSIPTTQVGRHDRWVLALVSGSPDLLTACYLIPAGDLLRLAPRGRLVDGRDCLRVTLSPGSPKWGAYRTPVGEIGDRLLQIAPPATGLAFPQAAAERQQEEGGYFEAAITAALLGGTDQMCIYRPAVDLSGRDLLIQRAGTASHLYIQVKGTAREDVPDHAHFQVRRRTFAADPTLVFVFAYRDPDGRLGPLWAVDAVELERRSATGDADHISFEPRIRGDDPRWGHRRLRPEALAAEIMARLGQPGPAGEEWNPGWPEFKWP